MTSRRAAAAPILDLRVMRLTCAALALGSLGQATSARDLNDSYKLDSGADVCVSRSASAASAYAQVSNGCNEIVTVYYCNVAKPISGKRCGEQPHKANVYYTHTRTLKPGESSTFHHPSEHLRIALCLGPRAVSFTSAPDGRYSCQGMPMYRTAQAHAIGSSRDEACEAARDLFAPALRTQVPCDCVAHKRGTGEEVHHCKAYGAVDPARAPQWEPILNLKDWVHEKLQCAPESCRRTRGIAIGVRS
jgi:hypothetical protein